MKVNKEFPDSIRERLRPYSRTEKAGLNNLWKIRGRTVKNCHMWSDESAEELLEFAEKIGLKKNWIQKSRRGLIHFDLVEKLREKAVQNGAIPLTNREAYKIRKRMKLQGK